MAVESYWNLPVQWNRRAQREQRRIKVFCASLADWLEDRPDLVSHRERLCALVEATPHLDWWLLTKRPENYPRLVPRSWLAGAPSSVVTGTTIENRKYWNIRISHLLAVDARRRLISFEPLLGPVQFYKAVGDGE